ncbi:N-acetyltransferase eso1 [Coemansia sp. BCRC 34301]|nr:N-acetyltransferase eso1 [Coemansia sp. BCRC 34301]
MIVSEAYRPLVADELARSRAIIHIDLDCFYCQVEQLRLGIGPDAPLAVQQWQGLVAVNYPARARGVKRLDTVMEAREKCPDIKFVHVATFTDSSPPAYYPSPSATTHKVSLDEYRRASRKIMDVVRRLCPTMSKASIDEAYLDVSEIVKGNILLDLERGQIEWATSEEAAWASDILLHSNASAESAQLLPVPVVRWITMSRKGKEREPVNGPLPGATDFGILVGDAPPVSYSWGDLQLKYAAKFASHVRGVIFEELGYRCSAGIAHNKLLAKIGSALNKPNLQTVILQSQVEAFMYTFPLSGLPSLGGKLGALIEVAFDAQTAGDIMPYTIEQLAFKLGHDQALLVFNKCRAIDHSEVVDKSEPQSLSSTKNFMRYPIFSMAKLERWISMNSTDLWMRTGEEWELRKRWPRSLTIGYTTNGITARSRTVPFPSRHVPSMRHSPDAIVTAARACLEKIAVGDGIGHDSFGAGFFPLISLSLTAKGFQRELANVTMMEKWLTTKPVASEYVAAGSINTPPATAGTEPIEEGEELLSLPSDFSAPSDGVDYEMCGHLYEGGMPEPCSSDVSSPVSSNDLHHIPDPPASDMMPPIFGLAASQAMPSISTFADAVHHHHMPPPMLPPPLPAQSTFAAPPSAMYTHGILASSTDALSAAPTPPLVPSRKQHARGGSSDGRPVFDDGYVAWADSMRPPPLLSASGTHPGLDMESDYDSSDSEQSCLRTPQETDSEDCEVAENDHGSDTDPDNDNADIDDGGSGDSGGTGSDRSRECSDAGSRTALVGAGPKQRSSDKAHSRSTSTGERHHSDESMDNEPGPPSRATTVSLRRRADVYIQHSADLETASRYGEGYKHMNIDQHDDGSLVVASPEEAPNSINNSGDGFIPALIAATRRKRDIQIFRFQNSVDAPDGAISGTLSAANMGSALRTGAGSAAAGTSRANSNRHSRNSSIGNGAESSFMATVRSRLEGNAAATPIAEEDGDDGVEDAGAREMGMCSVVDDSSEDDEIDMVLDIAVNAMMESISASQAVMQIRCPRCPETEPAISSQEWETHRDWHIARQLQEKELRHDTVSQQLQRAFHAADSNHCSNSGSKGSASPRPASKKARLDGEQKRRQQTIGEAWK